LIVAGTTVQRVLGVLTIEAIVLCIARQFVVKDGAGYVLDCAEAGSEYD
jgi:hypothetical protein